MSTWSLNFFADLNFAFKPFSFEFETQAGIFAIFIIKMARKCRQIYSEYIMHILLFILCQTLLSTVWFLLSGNMDTDNNTTSDTSDYSMIKHNKIIIEGVALPLVGCIGIFGKIFDYSIK